MWLSSVVIAPTATVLGELKLAWTRRLSTKSLIQQIQHFTGWYSLEVEVGPSTNYQMIQTLCSSLSLTLVTTLNA
jgi:hypothetical protein